jgi:nicotinate-nucleotide pyrophosphorylase
MLDLETRNFRSLIVVEASGGIGYDDLQTWKDVRVDVVSTSGLHRGAKPLDLSMLFEGS